MPTDKTLTSLVMSTTQNAYVLTGAGTLHMQQVPNRPPNVVNTGSNTIGVAMSFDNDTTLTSNANSILTVSGNISGAGKLVTSGAGTVSLTGTNNYASTVIGSGSTLQVAVGSIPVGNGVVNSGTLAFNRADIFTVNQDSITGTGVLANVGSGSMT